MTNYAAHIMKMPDNQGWSVYFPEIPNCFFGGATKEEALANAKYGLISYVQSLQKVEAKYLKKEQKRIITELDAITNAEIIDNGRF